MKSINQTRSTRSKTVKRGVAGFLLICLALAYYAYRTTKTVVVSGNSMLPLTSGTRLLISDAYWLIGPIRDKDVVVIKDNNPTGYIIKRVYKLGGEQVDFDLIPKNWSLEEGDYKVPDGMAYVLGDNREISDDSRSFGPVEMSRIIGKVVLNPGKRTR